MSQKCWLMTAGWWVKLDEVPTRPSGLYLFLFFPRGMRPKSVIPGRNQHEKKASKWSASSCMPATLNMSTSIVGRYDSITLCNPDVSIFHSLSFISEGESFLSETDIPSISQLEKRNDVRNTWPVRDRIWFIILIAKRGLWPSLSFGLSVQSKGSPLSTVQFASYFA